MKFLIWTLKNAHNSFWTVQGRGLLEMAEATQRTTERKKKEKLSPTMLAYVGLRIAVTLDDDTRIDGTLASFDKHGNMILTDAERTRVTKAGKPVRSAIPVVMLRGQGVLAVEHTPSIGTNAGIVSSYLNPVNTAGVAGTTGRRPAQSTAASLAQTKPSTSLNTPLHLN